LLPPFIASFFSFSKYLVRWKILSYSLTIKISSNSYQYRRIRSRKSFKRVLDPFIKSVDFNDSSHSIFRLKFLSEHEFLINPTMELRNILFYNVFCF
jgi:hypothetical protein